MATESHTPTTKMPLRDLLRHRDFRWIYFGQIVSDFGDSLTFLSLLILVQRLGGSELQLAGVVIAATAPALVVGLLSGVFVDRWDRRRIMIVADSVRAVMVLGFVFVRSLDLLWVMYLLTFAQAAIGTMFNPARAALLADVVPRESLLAANSVSQTSRIIFNLVGTATAGILVGVAGTVWPAFVVDAVTFALSALLITRVAFRSAPVPKTERPHAMLSELTDGLRLLTRNRPLRGMLLAATVALLGLGAVNVLFVPFVIGELGANEAWLGGIEASQVAAMVLAGATVAVMSRRLRLNLVTAGGLLLMGLAVGAIALVHAPWQMMIVVFVAGLGLTPVQASAATVAQTSVEPELIGRSNAALQSVISAASVLSMGLAGVFATAIGIRTVFLISGAITLVAAAVAYWMLADADVGTSEPSTGAPVAVPVPAEA